MLIKTIDFPLEVLQAQKHGTLVVFAGAGISMPSPANLPDFAGLTQMIGKGTVARENDESEDRYLGRLYGDGSGVQVHMLASRILLDPESRPTELHRLVLRLFGSKSPVRIVTTNFDSHFSSVANDLQMNNVETFYAPALPLGNDFHGIVYLHGSAVKSPPSMVLTDGDFGRAYLTYGWASRFLYQLFSAYTVLFIGYSHNDIVMRYLARGLPPTIQHKRFGFSERMTDQSWKTYGIKPLYYEKRDNENPHIAITESFTEWVEEVHRGLLARSERIRSIVEAAPPLEGEDADYLKNCLADADNVRQFAKVTKDPAYLDWHGFLKSIFDPKATLNECEKELLTWIVGAMLGEHSERVLALVQRNGQILHREFCWRIHRSLIYRRQKQPGLNEVFPTWVCILLSQPHTSISRQDWAELLNACRWPEDKECAILIFSFMTEPRLVLEPSWGLFTKTEDANRLVEYNLDLGVQTEYWLVEVWKKFFKPNLNEIGHSLGGIVTGHLRAAHALLVATGRANNRLHPFSLLRQTIKGSGQFPKLFDTVVNAARDIIEQRVVRDAPGAWYLIEEWFASNVPILGRLAIYGVTVSPHASADEKLRWALDKGLIYRRSFKSEVFALLRAFYPAAPEDIRRLIVNITLQGAKGEDATNLDEKTIQYEIINLLGWLIKADPNCEIARDAFQIAQDRNPEFSVREHPDEGWSWSGWRRVGSGFNLEEILAEPPSAFLNKINDANEHASIGERREDYIYAIMALVSKNAKWGIALQAELRARGITDPDIWAQIFNGWREAVLSEQDWRDWFQAIDDFGKLDPACAEGIVEVLCTHGNRGEPGIPDDLLERAYGLSLRVWEAIRSDSLSEGPSDKDWLGLAINRPGGKLAQFWLSYLSASKRRLGDKMKAVPEPLKTDLIAVAEGSGQSATLARVIIASQFHYFFYLDSDFARQRLLPLFNWALDERRALACWNGFLSWGKWQKAYIEEMLPFYLEAAKRMHELTEMHQESLVAHIAGIAIYGKEDALEGDRLGNFIRLFELPMLRNFAKHVGSVLEGMAEEPVVALWHNWLSRYWEGRLLGKPVALQGGEIDFMAQWPLHLQPVFESAVELLLRSPKPESQIYAFPENVEKLRELCAEHANAVADYLLLTLNTLQFVDDREPVNQLVTDLVRREVSETKVAQIRDELLRLQ